MSVSSKDANSFKVLVPMVLLFAGPVLWSWFSPPDPVSVIKTVGEKAARGIASIGTSNQPINPKSGHLSRPVTVDWNLSASAFTKDIDGTHLRLRGLMKGYKAETITNQTNGFTASVFLTGDEFTTDFIELKEGTNQIQVEVQDASGRKITKRLDVTRRAPASL